MPLRKMKAIPGDPSGELQPLDPVTAVAELDATEPHRRQAAARSLHGQAGAALALCERFAVETHVPTREALAVAIMRTGGAAAVERLLPLLSSEDAALRNSVIEILQALPDDVGPQMRRLLGDANSDVRIFAVNVLQALKHPDVETWLIDVISRDRHVNVVATALDILGEVGTEAAMEALTGVTERFADQPYVRFAASHAIKRIGA